MSFLDADGLKHYTDELLQKIQSNTFNVTSFNGRVGDVFPIIGDYSASMITGAVPETRSVNGKPLSNDITLTADDIEGLNAITPDLSEYVPISRTVNGKSLSTDIVLNANDIEGLVNLKTVGESMANQVVKPTSTTTVVSGEGCEIFNDYRDRTFNGDEAYAGNVASGNYSHAEGYATTASSIDAHAEGYVTIASGTHSHAEGYKTKASMPASHAEGQKTAANGESSHAEGKETTASGEYSHAEGNRCVASGSNSHAEGSVTKAIGNYSHAEGSSTEASEGCAHAEGTQSKALGADSHAEGYITTASGKQSHAEGYITTASGQGSHAEGERCVASGDFSYAGGQNAQASGKYSHAIGVGAKASNTGGYAIGKGTRTDVMWQIVAGLYNVISTSETDKFVLGKGTGDSTRSNCLRITDTGVFASGSYHASGADYAEFFEWADGNVDNEDRIGLFVTLEEEYIRIANQDDHFIIGITSGNPSIVGDVYDDQWKGMYLYDIYGRPIFEDVEIPDEIVEEPNLEDSNKTITRVLIPAHVEHHQKINPNYDATQIYVPRSHRKEWACVGMIGKIVVQDDGSCEINGYAKVGENGKATKSEHNTKFRVMSRIDESHIKLFINSQ